MKAILFITSLIFFIRPLNSQVYWNGGGGDGLWSNSSNWQGGVVPGTVNDVILDNTYASGSYTVTLPNTSVTINSVTITPLGSNTIKLLLPSTNTITTNAFVTLGMTYTITLNNGGIFDNNSGATSGTNLTLADSMRINNGGVYIHHTRSGHAGWNNRLARIAGTENGVFNFDVPSAGGYAVSTSGNRVFGTLQLSAVAAGGTKSYTSNASGTLTLNGNLQIDNGVTYIYSPPAAGIIFNIKGNCTVSSTASFDISASPGNMMTMNLMGDLMLNGTITASGASPNTTFNMTGSAIQQITAPGNMTNAISFVMNNSSGATLNSSFILPYNLTLTSGNINSSSFNPLILASGATVTGGSTGSLVDGPLKKIGNTGFTYPVGTGSIYAPVTLVNGINQLVTDTFTVQYIRSNPQSAYGTSYAGGIDHISYAEYWIIDRNNGSAATKYVSLDVHQSSFCLLPANTFISRFNGTNWTNETSTPSGFAACGFFQCGTLTTNNSINGFGPFTLATDQPFGSNPLPVQLTGFHVSRQTGKSVLVSWDLAAYCSDAVRFEVQRSADGIHFTTIKFVPGSRTSKHYDVNDEQLDTGILYYRLRIVEPGDVVSYSNIEIIIIKDNGVFLVSFWPDPVKNMARFTINSTRAGPVLLSVYNFSGQEIKQWQTAIREGNTSFTWDLSGLPAGLYWLRAGLSDMHTEKIFMKE